MPESLSMRVGDRTRLKPPADLEHWVSDHPDVAAVTDVDVVRGLPGGEVQGRRPGRARIHGLGPGGAVRIVVDVMIEGSAAAVLLTPGAVGQLPLPEGIASCRTAQMQVVEVDNRGRLRALGPGIALVRCAGNDLALEFQVRVSGILDVPAGDRIALADRVGVPVRHWRVGSSSVAQVDSQGRLQAGRQARSTPVQVTLDGGEVFSFDIRILAGGPAPPTAGPALLPGVARHVPSPRLPDEEENAFPDDSDGSAPSTAAPPSLEQRREVERQLELIDRMTSERRWLDARLYLRAADVAASGHEDLKTMVSQASAHLENAFQEYRASALADLVKVLREKDTARLRSQASGPSAIALGPIAHSLARLAEALQAAEDASVPVETRLSGLKDAAAGAWRDAAAQHLNPVLVTLANLSAEWGLDEMAALMAESLSSALGPDATVAEHDAIVVALGRLGEPGVRAVLDRLCRVSASPDNWAHYTLCGIGMNHVAPIITAYFGALDAEARLRLLGPLARLSDQCPADFLVLMAAGLRRLPPDARLAEALLAALGTDRVERLACQFWGCAHLPAARILLERFFRYGPQAFA
jgi:hypothetical protein